MAIGEMFSGLGQALGGIGQSMLGYREYKKQQEQDILDKERQEVAGKLNKLTLDQKQAEFDDGQIKKGLVNKFNQWLSNNTTSDPEVVIQKMNEFGFAQYRGDGAEVDSLYGNYEVSPREQKLSDMQVEQQKKVYDQTTAKGQAASFKYGTSERLGSQEFQAGESEKNRQQAFDIAMLKEEAKRNREAAKGDKVASNIYNKFVNNKDIRKEIDIATTFKGMQKKLSENLVGSANDISRELLKLFGEVKFTDADVRGVMGDEAAKVGLVQWLDNNVTKQVKGNVYSESAKKNLTLLVESLDKIAQNRINSKISLERDLIKNSPDFKKYGDELEPAIDGAIEIFYKNVSDKFSETPVQDRQKQIQVNTPLPNLNIGDSTNNLQKRKELLKQRLK